MDGKPSIQKLVNDTQVYLTGVWDAMGTTTEARTAALETLREDLEQVLSRARDGADAERDELETERSTIQDEIAHMATCMEVAAEAPEQGSKGVIQHTAALRARAAELASLKMERVEQMSALCNEAAGLFKDIGVAVEPEFAAPGDKLTTSRVHSFENRIAELRADKEARRARIQPSCDAILGIWDDIGHAASGDEEAAIAAGPEAVGFADGDIEKLETCLEFWQAEKASREERIREIGERITVLWEKLDTPEGEQTTFLESHNGLGDDVIAACKAYMHAKAEEFQARLDELVAGLRERITQVWDEIDAGEEERAAFAPFAASGDAVDEACWEAHKACLAEIEARAERMRPILRIHAKRQELLADKDEYERIIADPTRLTSRRGGAARLREEKLERRIKRDLPKATAKLRAMTAAWEEEAGEEFVVGGERLLDALEAEAEAEAERKQRRVTQRHARRNGAAADAASSGDAARTGRTSTVGRGRRTSAMPGATAGSARSGSVRSASRSSVASHTSSDDRSTAGVPAAASAAAPIAAGGRKPLAKSTGAANARGAARNGKRAAVSSRIGRPRPVTTTAHSAADGNEDADEEGPSEVPLDPITPSAVKVARESRTAAAAMAEALDADY
ncbi:hypothetical protein FNF27_02354 [Cafeteria roenbergensis]|uniref:Uncharacterized protein n=1 Tax=Cafeteria roenbergensis TaxID=33653 RepID=A0A5A8EGD6_CAFRO|nr:hypothetical protein FNF27_02354 [Cafeteria roenbergensis]